MQIFIRHIIGPFVFLLLLAVNLSFGQSKFINIGKEKGLSNLVVKSLYQDSHGFLWIGTGQGLFRFDGYDCVSYFNTPGDTTSISSDNISSHAFFEDKDSNLWVGTAMSGLNFYNRTTEKFTRYQADENKAGSISMNHIRALEHGRDGQFWVATGGKGFNQYDSKKDRFRIWDASLEHPDLLMDSNLSVSLLEDRTGQLWVGTDKGVFRFVPSDETFTYFPISSEENKDRSSGFICKIFEDRKGQIWLGTAKGLKRLNQESGQYENHLFAPLFPGQTEGYNYVLDIFERDDGKFWLGTIGGLLLCDPVSGNITRVLHEADDRYSIGKGSVNVIMKDLQGNVWFGTDSGISILKHSSNRFQDSVLQPIIDSFPNITQFEGINKIVSANNALYFTSQIGLYKYKVGNHIEQIFPGNFDALFYDQQSEDIYAGTMGKGLYIFNAKNTKQKKHIPLVDTYDGHHSKRIKGHRIISITKDIQGYIWIGTNGCLNRYNPETGLLRQFFQKEKKLNNPSGNTYHHLLCDQKGNLWLASMGGLSMLTTEELLKPFDATLAFKHFTHQVDNPNSISNDLVYSLLESATGKLWVGTEVGLNCYDPATGKWTWYFKSDGLPNNKVVSLIADNNGDIWIGTPNDGLCKYDQNKSRFLSFTEKDGLLTEQFRPNSRTCTKEGSVIFGGRTGLVGFHPDSLMHNDNIGLPTYFTDFRIFNKSVPIGTGINKLNKPIYKTKSIEVDYSQKVISFQFTTLNYIHPEKQAYQYRLIPFHEEWQDNGHNREVTFTNLSPGKYALHVIATHRNSDWKNEVESLQMTLSILPPWYRTNWAYLLWIALLTGSIYILYRIELKRRLAEAEALKLKELDQAKSVLYTNITHEFRTPLTIILGMANQIKSDPKNWFNEGLQLIERNGKQLLNLVNQMLDLSKLESNTMPLKMVTGDIVSFIHYLTESFHSYADSKDIRLHFASDFKELHMDYDPDKLQNIISNLLSNAIKFTPSSGDVYFDLRVTNEEQKLIIQIRDNGLGIAPEHVPFIFDRFYQVDDTATRRGEGTGIGLALTKELIKLMGGEIEVESEINRGTKFSIMLPITKNAITKAEQNTEGLPSPLADSILLNQDTKMLTSAVVHSELPMVLIVEDNEDVVTYLSSFLSSEYKIEKAFNGNSGIEKAIELTPDLIVSDVMMPVKDGFELCNTLKKEERTSHIPIILLTAKSDQAAKIEGLSQGADAYLAKPFHKEELLVRIEKLIASRKRLQARYHKRARLLEMPEAASEIDQEDLFLKKLIRIVEENMADEHFGLADLCRKAGLSRSQLFRKLKALTGKGTTNFIRSIRLARGKELLEKTDLNVSEIAYKVGFGSPVYFTRTFKEEFGCSPSEVRNEEK